MLLNTITPTKITANLRKRFEVSGPKFLARLRRMTLAQLEPHVMMDDGSSPFIGSCASLELQPNGTFLKGEFWLRKKSKYPNVVDQRVYLFATEEEESLSALRAVWFQEFAFCSTTHRLEEFAAMHGGSAKRPLWVLGEDELHQLAEAGKDCQFFAPAISEIEIEKAMIETETVRLAVAARNELEHRATSSAHEEIARIITRRDLGMDGQPRRSLAA